MKFSKIFFAIIFSLSLFSFVYALDGDVSGRASSALIGDIDLSGVNFNLGNQSLGSGMASSVHLGDIDFGNTVCPESDEEEYTNCRPHIVWNSDGTGKMLGFARFCAVYESGCSGELKSDIYRGGWDGFISLGEGKPNWGVNIASDGTISGYGWGSWVLGWVDFSGDGNNKIEIPSQICIPPQMRNPITNLCADPLVCPDGEAFDASSWSCVDEEDIPDCPTGQSWNGAQCVNDPTGGDGGSGGNNGGGNGGSGSGSTNCPTGQSWNGTACVPKGKPGFEEF